MKLELKHLAPYLPYALKIQGITHGEIAELSCCTETSVNITTRSFQYGMWADIFDIKPILRPLSDLTKEINMDGDMVSAYEILPRREKEDYKNPIIGYWSWDAMQILFEWHFDVFGLIELGLAIDKNTL
tara:strand:- start:12 stop:398 length:387 start_codon:yes stop_codon:yes gene_type:complete